MSTHPYTCLTCALGFRSATDQRSHYATEVHRYNAKRKLAELPPVTEDQFNAKLHEQATLDKASNDSTARLHCKPCHKSFASDNAYAAHLHNKKHIQAAADRAEAGARPDAMATDGQDRPLPCLFCAHSFEDAAARFEHMYQQHGFFVPDREYLADADGLLHRLYQVISTVNVCLTCGLSFRQGDPDSKEPVSEQARRKGISSVQMHMRDKNHCKLPWDTEDERLDWSDYYDYSTSYADVAAGKDDDAAWEDMDGAASADDDASFIDDELEESGLRLGDNIYELVLPTGRRIGHRDMRNLYRQNFTPVFRRERIEKEEEAARQLAIADGTAQPEGASSLVVRSRDGRMLLASNPGQARRANQVQSWKQKSASNRFQTRVGYRHNSQKHFRDPLLQ